MKEDKIINYLYTSKDILRHAHISYRQLYRWEKKGLLSPQHLRFKKRIYRRYSENDLCVAKYVHDLINEGYALPSPTRLKTIIEKRSHINKES